MWYHFSDISSWSTLFAEMWYLGAQYMSKSLLTLWMLEKFYAFVAVCCPFSKSTFSKISLTYAIEWQTVRIQIRTDSVGPDLGPNCLQMLSQTTKVATSKERVKWNVWGFITWSTIYYWKEMDVCLLLIRAMPREKSSRLLGAHPPESHTHVWHYQCAACPPLKELCMLGIFSCFCFCLLTFFKINIFQ